VVVGTAETPVIQLEGSDFTQHACFTRDYSYTKAHMLAWLLETAPWIVFCVCFLVGWWLEDRNLALSCIMKDAIPLGWFNVIHLEVPRPGVDLATPNFWQPCPS
jgi:hypothetical protein